MPKYVLMFLEDRTWKKQSAEAKRPAYEAIGTWWDELMRKGVLKGGNELQPMDTAITVRRVNGTMKVSDGPFIESKEHVGGFGMIEVADLDEAIAIAKSWPGGDVEVRPIVDHSES
jgi:hypothetical protein